MRVRIKTCISGPEILLRPGEIVDIDHAYATRLIASGDAESVESTPPAANAPPLVVLKKRRHRVEKATKRAEEDTRLV